MQLVLKICYQTIFETTGIFCVITPKNTKKRKKQKKTKKRQKAKKLVQCRTILKLHFYNEWNVYYTTFYNFGWVIHWSYNTWISFIRKGVGSFARLKILAENADFHCIGLSMWLQICTKYFFPSDFILHHLFASIFLLHHFFSWTSRHQ